MPATLQAKKKEWHPIIAPDRFDNEKICESYVADSDDLEGRNVTVNMRDVTGDKRTQNMEIDFLITDVQEGKARTMVQGFKVLDGAIKRYIRKGRSRVDDSFTATTADGKRVRVKPLVVTYNRAPEEVLTKIRKRTKERIRELCEENAYEGVLDNVLNFNVQDELKEDLSELHPVRNFEIRAFRLL